MTSAHADPGDLAAAAAQVGPGHPVTVHPAGRAPLRLVTPADWAVGELWRAFATLAPPAALEPAAALATGREAPDVYAIVFQDAAGISAGEATRRALALVREVDRILADMYEALGAGAELAPVVPQVRADLLRRAHAEVLGVVRESDPPAEWLAAAERQPQDLHRYPAGRR